MSHPNRRAIPLGLVICALSGTGQAQNPVQGPGQSPVQNPAGLATYQPQMSAGFVELIRNADLTAGEAAFMRRCSACHDHQQGGRNSKGPPLWNVLGRRAGTFPEFPYSEAMRGSGHTWTLATLDYYLADTERAVPGRIMDLRGIKNDQERANLIAYLRGFNDTPPPLP